MQVMVFGFGEGTVGQRSREVCAFCGGVIATLIAGAKTFQACLLPPFRASGMAR